MNSRVIIRTCASRILFALVIVIFLIPLVLFVCVPKRLRYSWPFVFIPVRAFYWCMLKSFFISVNYYGLENIPHEAAIFIGNHQSSLDIPLMGIVAKGFSQIWIAKQELKDSFFIKYIIPLIAVFVDMSSPRDAMLSVRKVITTVNGYPCNIMIFPEGGRFTDGTIHPFFSGFMLLAKKTSRPIIPVCIVDIDKVYPPDSFWIYSHPVTVYVGKPFVQQEEESDDAFKERVHQWFVEQMEKKR